MTTEDIVEVEAAALEGLVQRLFGAVGLADDACRRVAGALVDADREGKASHGVMMVPLYVERIRAGSVSTLTAARVVQDSGAVVVMDAEHALGQLTAEQAMATATERALRHGVAAVAVRHAFHFGAASRYALAAAEQGCIGVAMCNTRPLMPAPGGAEALVGNNPVAIALPSTDEPPVVVDMALSEVAMGKIRLAQAAGSEIPANWATDADGVPTTDPATAIAGMLLPAAGPKGFGLAFMIDLLCGALSSGGWGAGVTPLFGDRSVPYDCAHFFLALNVASFRALGDFQAEVAAAAARVRASATAPGVERVYSPGELEWQRRADNRQTGDIISLPHTVATSLRDVASSLQVSAAVLEN